jgi:hypothetical protein
VGVKLGVTVREEQRQEGVETYITRGFSANINRKIKSRIMRRAVHVVCTAEKTARIARREDTTWKTLAQMGG